MEWAVLSRVQSRGIQRLKHIEENKRGTQSRRVRSHPVPATKEKMNLDPWRTGLHVRCGNTQHLPNSALSLNLSTGNRDFQISRKRGTHQIKKSKSHTPDSVLIHASAALPATIPGSGHACFAGNCSVASRPRSATKAGGELRVCQGTIGRPMLLVGSMAGGCSIKKRTTWLARTPPKQYGGDGGAGCRKREESSL